MISKIIYEIEVKETKDNLIFKLPELPKGEYEVIIEW